MRARVHVFVSGDVQGVGFRWFTREEAMHRSLTGWVRNLPDSRVEAVFEGEREAVDAMLVWCHRGPKWASVQAVEVTEEPVAGETGFEIRR